MAKEKLPPARRKKVFLVVPCLVAFDAAEAIVEDDDGEDADEGVESITVEQAVEFLRTAAILDMNTEECGNPAGWVYAGLHYGQAVEVTEAQFRKMLKEG